MEKKAVILGLDGLNWEIISILFNNNIMPNLKKIICNGYGGVLKSTIPPLTGPAWTTFQTGKTPASHGIGYFGEFTPEGSLKIFNSTDINGLTFYEIAEIYGKKCFIFNLPFSYPPKVDGDIIFSWLDKGHKRFYPNNLLNKQDQDNINEYFSDNLKISDYSYIKKEINQIDYLLKFAKANIHRINSYDLLFFLINQTDHCQHRIYDKIVSHKSNKYQTLYFELMKKIDTIIGLLMDSLGIDSYIFILSDHGFKKYEKTFHINTWLAEKGYLKRNLEYSKNGNIINVMKKYVLFNGIFKKPIKLFASYLKKLNSKFQLNRFSIDFDNSIAFTYFSSNYNYIFINDKIANNKVYMKQIIDELNKIDNIKAEECMPITLNGKKITGSILLWSTKYMISSSDLGLIWSNVNLNSHDINGLYALYGPDIKQGQYNADIKDIAPTLLYVMDLPLINEFDGKIIKTAIKDFNDQKVQYVKEDALIKARENKNIDTSINFSEENRIKEQLRSLGYL